MKKILTILSSISLTSGGLSSFVSCGKVEPDNNITKSIPIEETSVEPVEPKRVLEYKSNTTLSIDTSDPKLNDWYDVYRHLVDNPEKFYLTIDSHNYYLLEGLPIVAFPANEAPSNEEVRTKYDELLKISEDYLYENTTIEKYNALLDEFFLQFDKWVLENGGLDLNIDESNQSSIDGRTFTFFVVVFPEEVLAAIDEGTKISKELELEYWEIFKMTPLIESKNITIKTIQ